MKISYTKICWGDFVGRVRIPKKSGKIEETLPNYREFIPLRYDSVVKPLISSFANQLTHPNDGILVSPKRAPRSHLFLSHMARENDFHDSLQRDLFSLQELSRNET
jgi:hypothetical protein